MKKKNRSLLILTIAVSLVVGFLTGMLVDFPKTDNTQLSGTIGRVQNYKNVKVTEKDIELKNDLVSDTVMLKALSAWFNYYYVSAVSQGDKIRYALDQIQPLETYKEYAGVVLSDVAGYRTFLENTRTNLLLAGLHTVLTMDQLANAMALNDKMVIRYFQKKKLFTDEIQGSFGLNLKEIVVEDLSRLNAINDQSALNLLIILDQDNIGSSQIVSDAALIGQQFLLNETALQFYCSNMSELGYINKSSSTLENMQDLALGGVMFIMDATGELGGFFNMENLKGTGSFDKWFLNAQQLGFLNVSQLGAFMDKVSNLGGITSL